MSAMNSINIAQSTFTTRKTRLLNLGLLRALFTGLLLPLSFAPFHADGLAVVCIALFYAQLLKCSAKNAFFIGLAFGIGFFGFSVSWVAISIHDYGHLNYALSVFITCLFIVYLSLFPALTALFFQTLRLQNRYLLSGAVFSALWCLSEYARASLMTGFPWMLLGVSQMDTDVRYLAPIIGTFGVGLYTCFSSTLLANSTQITGFKGRLYIITFVILLLLPLLFKNEPWTQVEKTPISVGLIQSNISMRDKWDETLFWNLLKLYENQTEKLLGTQLIVMPESAIPLPSSYVMDYLARLDKKANDNNSAIILGIIDEKDSQEAQYFNTMVALGNAKGTYAKQHLVPFGEYIPEIFKPINALLELPEPNILTGSSNQPLLEVAGFPVASLICYEIAYHHLLKNQLPNAKWIISISDNGWFGKSLASYQQLQMAQMLSLQTGRYQIISNNNGLSSIISARGEIIESLPAFSSGVLQSTLFPATGATPWVHFGEIPILFISIAFLLFGLFLKSKHTLPLAAKLKRRYS